MAKQLVRKQIRSLEEEAAEAASLAELKALRRAQRASSQRIEELKLRLFQVTERHMEQALAIMKKWIKQG